MSYIMKDTGLKQEKGTLKVNLRSVLDSVVNVSRCAIGSETSSEFAVCGLVKIQVQNVMYRMCGPNVGSSSGQQNISIKLTKLFESDDIVYEIMASSTKLNIDNKVFHCISSDISVWQSFFESKLNSFYTQFDMKFKLNLAHYILSPFATLYDDTELTDFELCAKDGAVQMHKSVLAAFSPMLKTMNTGQWKESSSGSVEVVNTTKETLQHLKDYMYLHTLPENGIEELAALASYYMISDLEELCTVKLLLNLEAGNAANLLKLAVKYDMEKLMLAILYVMQKGSLAIEDMIKKFCSTRK